LLLQLRGGLFPPDPFDSPDGTRRMSHADTFPVEAELEVSSTEEVIRANRRGEAEGAPHDLDLSRRAIRMICLQFGEALLVDQLQGIERIPCAHAENVAGPQLREVELSGLR